jgi:crotonobetainyl-CoA:carnitine CoA-transferase CaiB-like acyl-CoA transferase
MSEGILSGLKVIDAASFIAGPASTTIMADFGAEVIKIEPPTGDPFRSALGGTRYPVGGLAHSWILDNRNKKGIVLNLKSDAGREVLYKLVADADVFVTNAPQKPRKRLRIRYEDLQPLNERLIYASLSAYGEKGPEAHRTGFDSTALWARSGLMDLVKPSPDSAPARSLPGMGDHPTAATLFGAIMMGLYKREQTGEGSMVSTSLMANGIWSNGCWLQAELCGNPVRPRPAREDAEDPLINLYRTSDDRWLIVTFMNNLALWPNFTERVGQPELSQDPRFATPEARSENSKALIEALDQIFATKSRQEWRDILNEMGLTFGEVQTIADVPKDRQMLESGALRRIDNPDVGVELTIDSPVWMEGAEKMPIEPAPELGEHTVEVLRKAGYDDAEIDRLRKADAIP